MCYAATHPDKLDASKLAQWQKLARLSDADMGTLTNLECLGVPVLKRSKPGRLAGLVRKRNRAVRKVRCIPPLMSWAFRSQTWQTAREGVGHGGCTRSMLLPDPEPSKPSMLVARP